MASKTGDSLSPPLPPPPTTPPPDASRHGYGFGRPVHTGYTGLQMGGAAVAGFATRHFAPVVWGAFRGLPERTQRILVGVGTVGTVAVVAGRHFYPKTH